MDPVGTSLTITDFTKVLIGGSIVFMYKVIPDWRFYGDANDLQPKFTGPNLNGRPYRSPASSNLNQNPNFRFGNRWSVVGKKRGSPGVLVFGVEDMTWSISDMDFDDVVFEVSGLSLGLYNRDLDRRSLVW